MNDIEMKGQKLLQEAVKLNASDIHFNPRKDDMVIEIRVNNVLYEVEHIANEIAEKLISHFKFRSGMDIGEKRRPQNGSLDIYIHNQLIHFRLSTLPSIYNESLVLRLLPQSNDPRISDLSIFKEATTQLESLLNYQNGLLLISGPTGSGKTTTLYTMLAAAKHIYNARIVTLEDPVEKKNESFIQMEVNERASLSYSEGFKAILRHDPDIIMVGEIRDSQTAQIAVRAALTGHLILSTVHAYDTFGTVQRLLELGIPLFDLKETLVGVVSQRLATLHCPTCNKVCQVDCPAFDKTKRTAVFEILAGMPLHEVLTDVRRKPRSLYKKLDDYMRQGLQSGALSRVNKSEVNWNV